VKRRGAEKRRGGLLERVREKEGGGGTVEGYPRGRLHISERGIGEIEVKGPGNKGGKGKIDCKGKKKKKQKKPEEPTSDN